MSKINLNRRFFIQENKKANVATGFQPTITKTISGMTGVIDYNNQSPKKVFIKQSGANFSK